MHQTGPVDFFRKVSLRLAGAALSDRTLVPPIRLHNLVEYVAEAQSHVRARDPEPEKGAARRMTGRPADGRNAPV